MPPLDTIFLQSSTPTTLPCSDPHVVITFCSASISAGNFERLRFVVFLGLPVYYESHIFKNQDVCRKYNSKTQGARLLLKEVFPFFAFTSFTCKRPFIISHHYH